MNNAQRLMIVSALLMSTPAIRAYADETGSPAMEAPDHGPEQAPDAAKLQKKLGLTDDQTKKLESILQSQKAALQPLHEKMRDSMKTLRQQVDQKASDDDIKKTLDALKTNRDDMMAQHKQFQDQIQALLTPTQQAKMLLGHMHGMQKRMGGKGMGMGHSGGPGTESNAASAAQ